MNLVDLEAVQLAWSRFLDGGDAEVELRSAMTIAERATPNSVEFREAYEIAGKLAFANKKYIKSVRCIEVANFCRNAERFELGGLVALSMQRLGDLSGAWKYTEEALGRGTRDFGLMARLTMLIPVNEYLLWYARRSIAETRGEASVIEETSEELRRHDRPKWFCRVIECESSGY